MRRATQSKYCHQLCDNISNPHPALQGFLAFPLADPEGLGISKSVYTPAYQHFLALLRQTREEKGLSQRELGRRLGVHHNFVSSSEMGDRTLNFVEMRAWCRALEVSWVEFTKLLDDQLTADGVTGEIASAQPPSSTP